MPCANHETRLRACPSRSDTAYFPGAAPHIRARSLADPHFDPSLPPHAGGAGGDRMPRVRIPLLLLLVFLATTPARAMVAPPPLPDQAGAVALDGATRLATESEARALEATPTWQAFRAAHGSWSAVWNSVTQSPHRAFGPSFALPGFQNDAVGVDQAVRAFIASEPGVFGQDVTLETASVSQAGSLWYVSYRRVIAGLPVLFADWEVRVSTHGNLVMVGADTYRPTVSFSPRIAPAVAREAAHAGLTYDASRDQIEGGEKAYLLPMMTENGVIYRPVLDVRVHTSQPIGNWLTMVDAETGEVRWRLNRVRYTIGGNVSGQVNPFLPTDPLASRPFPHLTVHVGANNASTDASGAYSAPAAGTVTVSANLLGDFCNVNRSDGVPDASFSTSASDSATVNVTWMQSHSHDAERDRYWTVNVE